MNTNKKTVYLLFDNSAPLDRDFPGRMLRFTPPPRRNLGFQVQPLQRYPWLTYFVQENVHYASIVLYFQIIKFVTRIMNFTYYNDIILSYIGIIFLS